MLTGTDTCPAAVLAGKTSKVIAAMLQAEPGSFEDVARDRKRYGEMFRRLSTLEERVSQLRATSARGVLLQAILALGDVHQLVESRGDRETDESRLHERVERHLSSIIAVLGELAGAEPREIDHGYYGIKK